MPDSKWVEQIVEKAVSQALESALPQLREGVVRSLVGELQPVLEKDAAQGIGGAVQRAGAPDYAELLNAISAIHAGGSQKEILRALLDSTAHYSGRSALFVMKSGLANGWQARGFEHSDEVKDFPLNVNSDLIAQALQSRAASRGMADQVDPRFITKFGASKDGRVLILPLLLKDKIAALVYVDGGTADDSRLDASALEILVAATGAWLEVASLRKQAHKDGSDVAERFEAPAAMHAAPAVSDPFASHAPMHVAAEAVMESASAEVEQAPAAMAAAAGSASGPSSAPHISGQDISTQDNEIHMKAQRFARLLSDELKLYNQAKVGEGRKNRDLYDRLKEDIDKSRASYQKRYGSTAAASADYFNQELVKSLAEDDISLMGPNFHS